MTATVRLGDWVDIQPGYPFRSSEFTDTSEGVRLLRGDNVGQGRLRWDGVKRWRGDAPAGYELETGDVVLAMDRPWIGAGLKYANVSDLDRPALLVQRVARLRARDGNDQTFLRYVIGGPAFTDYVLGVQTGTAVPHISGRQIAAFTHQLPHVDAQRAIAEVLGALDDKIAANDRLVRTQLELGRLRSEQAREDLARRPLREIASVVLGGTPSRANPAFWSNGSVPWLASGAVNRDIVIEPTELITEEALARSAAKMMPGGSTLLAITGVTLGQVAWLGQPSSGNQSIVGVSTGFEVRDAWLHFAIRAEIPQLMKKATGAAQQHVSKGDVLDLLVDYEDEAVAAHGPIFAALLNAATAVEQESRSLARLRDTLLPALMTGRLSVKDAENTVSEVV